MLTTVQSYDRQTVHEPVVASSLRVSNAMIGDAFNQYDVIEDDCTAAEYWENLTNEVLSSMKCADFFTFD